MDSDCLICFGNHLSADCPDKKNEHCPDCFVFIKKCSDHLTVCGLKQWLFKPYEHLYVKPPKERCIISVSSPVRFLKDGCWRKCSDGIELLSVANEALLEFRSERDLCLLSTEFAPIRIIVVVKQRVGYQDVFREKLMLLTSRKQMIVAKELDKIFDRNATAEYHDWFTTLILVVAAKDNPVFTLNVFPLRDTTRNYEIQYDAQTNNFVIPNGLLLKANTEMSPDEFNNDQIVNKQIENAAEVPERNLQLIRLNPEVSANRSVNVNVNRNVNAVNGVDCPTCFGAQHTNDCGKRYLESCFECHLPIDRVEDHAKFCSVKYSFARQYTEVYVKIATTRCELSFKSQLYYLHNGHAIEAGAGTKLLSCASDSYFRILSSQKIALMTSGFTRIRIPIVVEGALNIEKIVLMTSLDRSMVAANGSRIVSRDNILKDYEHNTPLVLYMIGKQDLGFSVSVYSIGGKTTVFDVEYDARENRYVIPRDLDVKAKRYTPCEFDAAFNAKPKRN